MLRICGLVNPKFLLFTKNRLRNFDVLLRGSIPSLKTANVKFFFEKIKETINFPLKKSLKILYVQR